jgi:ribulose-5-phosphate 4-epimerase/fuculose-1-phosphate aldolase
MNAIGSLSIPSLKGKVSPAEWQARVELAACYRLTEHYGYASPLGTHLSARVPDEPDHFLLNPVGLLFDEMTASSFIKVDMEGNKLTESPYRVNGAGVEIHGAAYEARPDVMAALHTHTENGVAISMMECGLLSLSQTAMRFHKRIAYHDFAGPADAFDERERMGRDLGPHMAMIMKNHGLLIVGRTVGEAFVVMLSLEGTIASQLTAQQTGVRLNTLEDALCDQYAANRDGKNERNNDLNWQTFMRQADRLDPSYRE